MTLDTVRNGFNSLGRGAMKGVAFTVMLVMYGFSSLTSAGLGTLGLTGAATGLTLAATAEPASAQRRRRRRYRRGCYWIGPIYFCNGRQIRRRRRRSRRGRRRR